MSDFHQDVATFADELRGALLRGDRFKVPALGTFTTCTRKATTDRAACTIAMFRASKELRAHVADGSDLQVSGPHAELVTSLVAAMQAEHGVDVPGLGHLEAVRVAGKTPRLIFHADPMFNDLLTRAATRPG